MADPGLIMLVRERWPEMPIHLSVQANTTNAAGVRFWQNAGVSRVILSRELSLDEIAEIRQQCPDMELEVFVHGALCIAYSGRCLLSGYFNHRDANQGTCTNACRWEYNIGEIEQPPEVSIDTIQRHPKADEVYYIEERGRPGELMPIMEDEMGTYIMNSKDLRAVEHVQRLVEIGIDCLKIEGRTKSHYYTARTAQVYRRAIDDAVAGGINRILDVTPGIRGARAERRAAGAAAAGGNHRGRPARRDPRPYRGFDGTQPVFRQSPPILCFSIRATLAFTAAAMYADTRPPDPAPMTSRL